MRPIVGAPSIAFFAMGGPEPISYSIPSGSPSSVTNYNAPGIDPLHPFADYFPHSRYSEITYIETRAERKACESFLISFGPSPWPVCAQEKKGTAFT
jgi:hypothetical protein